MAVVNEAGRTTQYRNSRTLYYRDVPSQVTSRAGR